MGDEHLGKGRLTMNHIDDRGLLQSHYDTIRHGCDGGDALQLPRKASFAEESTRSENRNDRFLALLGNDGHLRLAFLHVEDRVGGIALGENDLVLVEPLDAAALSDFGDE